MVKGRLCGERGHAWQRGACVAKGGMCGEGSMRGEGAMCGEGGGGACVAEETATAADGTHPTGMHSCGQSLYNPPQL